MNTPANRVVLIPIILLICYKKASFHSPFTFQNLLLIVDYQTFFTTPNLKHYHINSIHFLIIVFI